MIQLRCKQTGQIFEGKLVAEYPTGWSLLTTDGLVWFDGRYFEIA